MKNKEKSPSLSLEEIAFKIANEPAVKEDGSPLEITKAEKILRSWAVSDNPTLQTKFMDLALQKKDKIESREEKAGGLSKESAWVIETFVLGIHRNEDDPIIEQIIEKLDPDLKEKFGILRSKVLGF